MGGTTKAYESEQPILDKVLKKIEEEELRDIYDFVEPIGRGGAGIVIRINDKRLDLDRALKIPRPKGENLVDSVKNEIEHLTRIRHENIISIYTLGEVKIPDYPFPYPYFVMDYIEKAQDLRKKTLALLSSAKESKELKEIMKWIADKLYRIADAVNFLHKHQIIHFDIKPSNILIDIDDKPILSDLGFAKKRSEEETPIVVGFTLFYAHPDLRFEYRHMSSKNRVRKEIAPKDFNYFWDIYAFGKSLLEILALVDQRFPDVVVYDFKFLYLHLLACRMLDGRNLSQREAKIIRDKQTQKGDDLSVYKETWLELDASDFAEIKYQTFEVICRDFEKLLLGEHFLESIPELNTFYPKRVQSSQGIPAPFSERVKYIIEHPVFSRLSYVYQLGLLNFVYPTATHTRLEHSIGTFRNCCLYIQSLYNDPYNPLFRQLINEQDIKRVLLASLLHDLGQYPLAHDMGEVATELKHENFTPKFLNNSTKDKFGHTLQDIIENEDWGWGVKLGKVEEVLIGEKGQKTLIAKKGLKTKMLSSMIDGPIDADKLDYLLRDSQNCYLRYGELIDFDRLIRDLTVIITKDTYGQKTFTIGTYEKGQSAAESLTFARYLLYQSLYWHHAARAVRTMLREAIKPALKERRKGRYNTFIKELEELIGVAKEPHSVIVDDMLNLIEKWADEEGKKFIELIKYRNYYKRILTIHSYPSPEEGKKSLLERFKNVYKETGFQDKLQEKIKEKFENYLYSTEFLRVSLLAPDKTDKTVEILSTPKKIICDCPEPNYGTSENLRFVPEPQRLQRNYFTRATIGERVSEVWNQVYFRLMNIASKGRVFCHPDIRDTLMAAIGPEGIRECLESVIKDYEH
jgi:HD superfamily phosphohydrolase